MNNQQEVQITTPDVPAPEAFDDAAKAVDRLIMLYQGAVRFLSDNFATALTDGQPACR